MYTSSWADIVSYQLFNNGIKNDITNSVTHIIVCLLKTDL